MQPDITHNRKGGGSITGIRILALSGPLDRLTVDFGDEWMIPREPNTGGFGVSKEHGPFLQIGDRVVPLDASEIDALIEMLTTARVGYAGLIGDGKTPRSRRGLPEPV